MAEVDIDGLSTERKGGLNGNQRLDYLKADRAGPLRYLGLDTSGCRLVKLWSHSRNAWFSVVCRSLATVSSLLDQMIVGAAV